MHHRFPTFPRLLSTRTRILLRHLAEIPAATATDTPVKICCKNGNAFAHKARTLMGRLGHLLRLINYRAPHRVNAPIIIRFHTYPPNRRKTTQITAENLKLVHRARKEFNMIIHREHEFGLDALMLFCNKANCCPITNEGTHMTGVSEGTIDDRDVNDSNGMHRERCGLHLINRLFARDLQRPRDHREFDVLADLRERLPYPLYWRCDKARS